MIPFTQQATTIETEPPIAKFHSTISTNDNEASARVVVWQTFQEESPVPLHCRLKRSKGDPELLLDLLGAGCGPAEILDVRHEVERLPKDADSHLLHLFLRPLCGLHLSSADFGEDVAHLFYGEELVAEVDLLAGEFGRVPQSRGGVLADVVCVGVRNLGTVFEKVVQITVGREPRKVSITAWHEEVVVDDCRPEDSVSLESTSSNNFLDCCLGGEIPVQVDFLGRLVVPHSLVGRAVGRGNNDCFNACLLTGLDNSLGLQGLQSRVGEGVQENALASLRCLEDVLEVLAFPLEESDARVVQTWRHFLKVSYDRVDLGSSCKEVRDDPTALLASSLSDQVGGHV